MLFETATRFESNQSGIETKFRQSCNQMPLQFESNQSGIETPLQDIMAATVASLNRTRVELKHVAIMRATDWNVSLNRTRVELKRRRRTSAVRASARLNRTRVELKRSRTPTQTARE